MRKRVSPKSQPRFVVYATASEIAEAEKRAASAGLKNPNQWAGVVIRKELNRKNP